MRHITVTWSYPRLLKDYKDNPTNEEVGIYYVSRKITRQGVTKEYIAYIGKTIQPFKDRISQHIRKGKFPSRSPKYYVRFGTMTSKTPYPDEDWDKMILDCESALIYSVSTDGRTDNRYFENKSQTKSSNPTYKLDIYNIGYRGVLASEVDVREQE